MSNPPRLFNSVVLPLPEGPSSTTNSPAYKSRSTPSNARTLLWKELLQTLSAIPLTALGRAHVEQLFIVHLRGGRGRGAQVHYGCAAASKSRAGQSKRSNARLAPQKRMNRPSQMPDSFS